MEELDLICHNCNHKHPHIINRNLAGNVRTKCERCGIVFLTPRQGNPKRIWIDNKYSSKCKQCGKRVRIGAKVLWFPDWGILCKHCGTSLNWTDPLE